MRRNINETLLREYVRQVITEDEGDAAAGGVGDIGLGAEGPYGISFGSTDDLMQAFIQPFTDVFKTAVGKTKEITRKAGTLLRVSFEALITTLIPGLSANYTAIFDREKADIDKIRGEYKDVYDRTDKALASSDAGMLAFMASPALVLANMGAKGGAKRTKELLSAVTGGLSDKMYDGTKENLESAGRWALSGPGGAGESPRKKGRSPSETFESQLREDDEEDKKDKSGGKLGPKDILTNKKFLDKALSTPKAQEMQKAATETYRKTLKDVYDQAEKVLKNSKSVDDLGKMAGKKLSSDAKKSMQDVKKLPQEEQAKGSDMVLKGVRKTMKEFYVKNLTDHLDKVLKAGIPEESQYVKDYRDTIQKIKSL